MASAIKVFCESHGFNEVYGLLCHSGPPTNTQLLLAIMVLERLIGKEHGKGTARTELSAIRAAVDPLHKAARLRDSTERQAAEIAGIEATIRELKKKNRDLLRVLEIEPEAKESCRCEATPDAQEVTYSDSDSEKTQEIVD